MESSGSRSGISPEEMMMRQQQMAENEEKRVSILGKQFLLTDPSDYIQLVSINRYFNN